MMLRTCCLPVPQPDPAVEVLAQANCLVALLRHHVIYQEEIYSFRRSGFSRLWMVVVVKLI